MKSVHIRIYLVILLIIPVVISNRTYSQSSYRVSGKVFLEDKVPTGPHDGVTVRFYTLPGKILKDSTTSQTDGSYSKLMAPGYYLVEWTKPGYVFEELGGLALAADTTLSDKTLIPGAIQYVSGDVMGTWTRSYVYVVTGDIKVPQGFTLTIEPGVRVKFNKNTGLTCYGNLTAQGTASQRIKFSSNEANPLPGDWKQIYMNGASAYLKYVDYDFASSGITGYQSSGSRLENVKISQIGNASAGGLYFYYSNYMVINNCDIQCRGEYGIVTGGEGCTITNNRIIGPFGNAAISTDGRRSTRIDSNIVGGKPLSGIVILKNDAVDTTYIRFNSLDVATNGIRAGGSKYNISNNVINGFTIGGIINHEALGITNSLISGNRLISDYSTSGNKIGIAGQGNITNNFITLRSNSEENYLKGIQAPNSIIEKDTVIIENAGAYECYGIFSVGESSASIKNNFIKINVSLNNPPGEAFASFAIKSGTGSQLNNTIQGNTIELENKAHGIMSWYSSISQNIIRGVSSSDRSRGTAFSTLYVKNHIFENVISNVYNGFYNSSSGYEVKIESNTVNCLSTIITSNLSNLTVQKNLFTTEGGNGINIDNSTTGKFVNNTLIRLAEPMTLGEDFGLYMTNNSTLILTNNIIQGFSQGIYSDNSTQNFNINHNNLWRIKGVQFSGTAMPPLIGQPIDQNTNGDPSDIYKNVSLDPGFIHPDTNFHLSNTSKMINAGDPTILDPDGTVSDIGAFPYYIWVSVVHQAIGNTANTSTPYQIDAQVYSPANNPVTAKLYYRLNGGSFTELPMTNSSGRIFGAQIPAQPLGTLVEYYIEGADGTNITRSPVLAPTQLHSFNVTLIQQYSRLNGVSNSAGKIVLSWDDPQLVNGNIAGLGVYRSASPYVTQGDLYTTLSDTANTYIDENVSEGDVFYYRIGSTITHPGGSVFLFVSNETSVMSDATGYVLVKGKASLQDTSNFAGIMIEFERTSPSPIKRDTVYTDALGNYKYIPTAGIYNINVKKSGWLPLTIPEKILTQNIVLDSVLLRRGSVISISGNVSGKWLTSFAYNVTGNLTIPAGDTLYIEKGTLVKFSGNFNLTVNGVLIADGDSLERIEFTSGKTVNRPGDWGSIVLNAPGSIIRYANYKYATDGLVGNNASKTVIEYCIFSNMPTVANGVVFSNSRDLRINFNDFQLIQGNGIYAPYAKGSQFNSNIINSGTSFAAIYAEGSDSSQINYNIVRGKPETGISGGYTSDMKIIGNSLSVKKYGITVRSGRDIKIIDNSIKEYYERGIDFDGTTNAYIYNNQIEADTSSYGYAIYCYYGISQSIIRKNRIIVNVNEFYVLLHVNVSIIDSNEISINCRYFNQLIFAPSSEVKHNNFNINVKYGGWSETAINTSAGGPSIIESNTILCNRSLTAIKANNSEIMYNDIKIGGGDKWAVELMGNSTFTHNRLSIVRNAILATSGADNSIINNDIFMSAGGRGMELQNSAVKEVRNNTLIANNGEIGLFVSNLTNPSIVGNHIQGFSTGLQAESQITDIAFNNFYNNATQFAGPGLPPIIGQISTVNANGTPSDVYNNIFVNPLFVNQGDSTSRDFHLTRNSPLINAGDPTRFDPDGTISDIGAYFYNFGLVPVDLKVDSTGNGSVSLSWSVEPTDSLTGFKVLYKTVGSSEWTSSDVFTGNSKKIEGLTNNTSYVFAVKAVYGALESNLSQLITAKPGVGILTAQRYIVAVQELNTNIQKTVALNNQGNRDVSFSFKTPFNSQYISVSDTTGFVVPAGSKNIDINYTGSVDGVRYNDLTIENNSNNEPEYILSSLQIVGLSHLNNLPPVKFLPVAPTAKVFHLVVNSAVIDGLNLSTGDEIAIFSGTQCVGAAKFNGQLPMIIKGYGSENGPEFTEGDSLIIKGWQRSTNRYSFLTPTLIKGSSYLVDGAFAAVDLNGSIYLNEKIVLAKNKFNLISSYLLPRNLAANSFFGGYPSIKIAYEDNGSAFIPQYNINTIGNIDITEGYHVFVTDSIMLNFEGVEVESVNYPLLVEKNRFNSIGYLYSVPMSIEYAFAPIQGKVRIVQDDMGGVWIPSLNLNTIGNLLPGKGYQIYTDSSASFSYTYPALPNMLAKGSPVMVKTSPSHFTVESTGLPYTITISDVKLGDIKPQQGDEIAVYDGNTCVGSTVWQSETQNYVVAWGGNEEAGLAGFKAGNKISFKYYSKENETEFPVSATFTGEGQNLFMGAAYASASLFTESSVIPDQFMLYNNYPNPFNPSTTIKFDLPENSRVSMVVYNLLGESVRTLVNSEDYKPGKYSVEWDGKNNGGLTVPSGVYLIRFETEKYREVKKAILLK